MVWGQIAGAVIGGIASNNAAKKQATYKTMKYKIEIIKWLMYARLIFGISASVYVCRLLYLWQRGEEIIPENVGFENRRLRRSDVAVVTECFICKQPLELESNRAVCKLACGDSHIFHSDCWTS